MQLLYLRGEMMELVDENTLEELEDSSHRHSSVVSMLATIKYIISGLGQRVFHLRKKVRWMRMMTLLVMTCLM